MALFQPGHKGGGRRRGARDKLSTKFLEELAADFEEHGAHVIRVTRTERPTEYLKIVAATLPREFELTDSTLSELTDEELREFIKFAKAQVISSDIRGGGEEAPGREPLAILQALPKAKDVL